MTLTLRTAVRFVQVVYTASPESFRYTTPKLRVVGHGIDTEAFLGVESAPDAEGSFVSIGRLAAAKGHELMLAALALLPEGTLTLYGAVARQEDNGYPTALIARAHSLGIESRLVFAGAVAHADVAHALRGHTLFFHASRGTGSLDKAPLESMLAGVPVISASEAFAGLLMPFGLSVSGDAQEFADAVEEYLAKSEDERLHIVHSLRSMVLEKHSLVRLVPRLIAGLQSA